MRIQIGLQIKRIVDSVIIHFSSVHHRHCHCTRIIHPSISVCVIILTVMLFSAIDSYSADPITVTAAVDRNQVYLFDRIQYQITVEGAAQSLPDPQIGDIKGFKVVGSPRSSSQISFINGRVTSKKVYLFVLEAKEEGTWQIPPATVSYNQSTFHSNALTIDVLKMTVGQSSSVGTADGTAPDIPRDRQGDLILWTVVDTPEPYIGQAITVRYYIYTRLQVSDFSVQQLPDFTGFWSEEVPVPASPEVKTKIINGAKYAEALVYQVVLYPTVTGELVIDPLRMVFQVESNQVDPFGSSPHSPFSTFFRQARQEMVAAQAITVPVKALPEQGKPDDFSGAVGQFELSATIDKDSVQAGEAVVLTVRLAGNHGLKTLPTPQFEPIPNVKSYDPKSEEVVVYPGRAGWKMRDFSYILVPHMAGDYQIPPVQYSYFNPEINTYATISTDTLSFHVTASAGSAYSAVAPMSGDGEIKLLGIDSRYIKTNVSIVNWTAPYRSRWFLGVLMLPIPAVPLILLYGRHRLRMMGDTGYARAFKARSESQKQFVNAMTAMSNQQFDQALDQAAIAFSRYLSNRFNLPSGGLTLEQVLTEMAHRQISEEMISRVRNYWEKLEFVRYSPAVISGEESNQLILSGRNLVDDLERIAIKKRNPGKEDKP